MEPFERGQNPSISWRALKHQFKDSDHPLTNSQAKKFVALARSEEIWMNDVYQVNVRRHKAKPEGTFGIIHLSVKRRIDKAPSRDWRDMQEIKNLLVGPEHEGVELYPAQSRLVDTANQFHMWVFDTPTERWPIGFNEREVGNNPGGNAVQREGDFDND